VATDGQVLRPGLFQATDALARRRRPEHDEPVNSCYTKARPVPVDADEIQVQKVRAEAVDSWFADLERRKLAALDAPDTELIDDAVVKINGRVAIARSWRVWGPVEAAPQATAPPAAGGAFSGNP
jgi:hypothetical protein